MYLIKCDKCNNLIEVKTEFLMLCPKCKSKLTNNFQDWKQQKGNKEKNFQDYLEEVCVSSEQLEEQQRQEELRKKYSPEKNKIRKGLNIAAAVLSLVIAIGIALYFSKMISEWWMTYILIAINAVIAIGAGIGTSIMTIKRKRFQTFVPALISLAIVALLVIIDLSYIILTGNI